MRNFTVNRSDTRTSKTKRWLGLLTFCFGILMGQMSFAQTYYTIGTSDGTNTSATYPSPLGDYYENQRTQTIYLASDLTGAGMTAGLITHLRWNVTALQGAGVIENFSIKMGTTSETALAQTAGSWVETTQVYAPVNYQPVEGLNTFDIDGFVWDGISNIVVEICSGQVPSNDAIYYTNNPGIAYQTMTYNASLTYRADNLTTSSCDYVGAASTTQNPTRRPLIDFGWTMLSDCTGTPNGGTASISSSTGNPGTSFMVSVSGSTAAEGLTYLWESSLDGVVWNEILGETGATLTATAPATIGTTVYYKRKTTCTFSTDFAYSTVVQFTTELTYCTPLPNTTGCSGDNIVSVVLGALSDTDQTCTPVYEDRATSQNAVPVLQATVSAPMSVAVGTGGTEYVGVWIDFNKNGVFDDAEFTALGSGNGVTINGEIDVPIDATIGTTKMRVRSKWNAAFAAGDACAAVGYGTTRDYTVEILPMPTCFAPTVLTASNFTHNSAELSWTQLGSVSTWNIEYGLNGFIPTGTPTISNVSSNPYTLTGLLAYTEYQYYVRADCGIDDGLSLWVGPFSFKTAYDCTGYTGDITSVTGGSICAEGTTTLQATASGAGDNIFWYDAATGGNLIGQGASFDTPVLTETTSFWATEVELATQLFTEQGNLSPTTLGSTTNGGINFTLNQTASIVNFEARSTTAAGGAVTYALIDADNDNAVLMTHEDTLPGGGTATSPVLYTVELNFNNIPAGNYRLIKQSGAASAYMTGAFPYPLGTLGEVTTGASSATSTTSTLYYHFFNITIEGAELLCESVREEVIATVHEIVDVDIAATTTSVIPGNSTTLTASSDNTNYTYAWSWDGGTDTGASITVSPVAHTTYTVTATDSITGCMTTSEIEILVFDTTLCNPLAISSTTAGGICEEGITTLQATAGGTGSEIYWYDAAVDGNLVGQGSSFETPFLTETTSYWAAEVLLENTPLAGQAFANPTTFTNSTSNAAGVLFEVTSPIKIVDVEVFGTNATGGDITIELRDVNNGNTTIATTTATITGGGTTASPIPHTIPLDFYVPVGSYRLVRTAATPTGVGMGYVTATNSNFPYPLGTSGQVTGGATATSTSTIQYFFFNWTIEEPLLLCESDREEVVATVHEIIGVDITASATSVSPGSSATLTASSTNTDYTYAWSWDGGTDTGASITVSPAAHTTYTVTATDSVTGCMTTSEIEILVFDITLCNPLEILSSTGASVCQQGTATLQATANGTGDGVYWYDAAVGGNKVGEGASFETPILTETTSYWASEVLLEGGTISGQGKPANTLTTGISTSGSNWGLMIEAYEPFTIVDVTVYSTGAGGDITVELQDATGTPINSVVVTVPGGGTATDPVPYVATLNLEVPAAGTYRLLRTTSNPATVNMVRESSGNSYPYPLGTVGQIPSGFITNPGSTAYYWFYNWTVSTSLLLCESDREEVVATVNGAAPSGDAAQELLVGSTLADFDVTATGTITWYSDDTLTTDIPDTTEVVDGTTYYVTQTIDGCESTALTITATVVIPPPVCDISVTISSSGWGDATTWELLDADNTVVLSGSNYGSDFSDTQTTSAVNPPYTLEITIDDFGWCDNSINYVVNVGGTTDVSGTFDAVCDTLATEIIAIGACPSCPAPNNLGVTNVTTISADLTWIGTASTYDVEWGTAGFAPTGTPSVGFSGVTSPQALTGLTTMTSYEFYVRQDCGTDGMSDWAGPFSFTTPCEAINSFPFTETFETDSASRDCWINQFETGTTAWSYMAGANTLGAVTSAHSGTLNARFGMDSYDAHVTKLVSPPLDLSTLTTPELNFWYSNQSWAGDINELRVYYKTSPGGSWELIPGAVYTSNVNTWTEVSLTLPSPSNHYLIAFEGTNAYGYGIALDDVVVNDNITPCEQPTDFIAANATFESVELTWTGTAGSYTIEYGAPGFASGTGTTVTGVASPYMLSGLDDETQYDIYIKGVCTSNESDWVGPVTFTTLEIPPPDPCSIQVTISSTGWGDVVTWSLLDNSGVAVLSGGPYLDDYSDTQLHIATNPPYTLQINHAPNTLFCDNDVDYLVTIGGVTEISDTVIDPCSGGTTNLPLTTDLTTCIPTCPAPTSLAAANITANSADLSWTSTGTLFDIEWGLIGFTQGTGTVINGVTAPYTLGGLSIGAHQFYVRQDCGTDGTSTWTGPFGFVVGAYQDGDIPTMNNGSPTITSTDYCVPEPIFTVNVPAGMQIAGLQVQYSMTATNNAYISEQRSFIYSPTLGMGEDVLAQGAGFNEGTFNYSRSMNFANGATGMVDFVLRAWRTWSTFGEEGCNTYNNYVNNGTWVITPTFEPIPPCPTPLALSADTTGFTEAILSWTSAGTSFDIEYGEAGFTPTGTPSTGLTGVANPYTLSGLTAETNYEYYVRQDCGTDGTSAWAGPFAFYTGYCIPTTTYTYDGYGILGFSTSDGYTNISNENNGLVAGYSNYSNLAVTQSAGSSINFSITVPGSTFVAVWIDLNQDLIFDPVMETLGTFEGNTVYTGSMPIPAGTPNGDYRIRIRSYDAFNGETPTPCGEMFYGETEDYTLTVVDVPACLPPSGLMVDSVTFTSADVSWTSSGTLFDIEYGVAGFTPTGTPSTGYTGIANTFATITGLTPDTSYQFYVRQDCGTTDGTSLWAGPFSFYTGYCQVTTTNTGDYISAFSTTGATENVTYVELTYPGAYVNQSAQIVEQAQGLSFNFSSNYIGGNQIVNIWIDWNNDMMFDDSAGSTEKVYSEHMAGAIQNGIINIPVGTPLGNYRMRVRAQYSFMAGDANPAPCGEVAWGSTVDFTLSVTPAPSCLPPTALTATTTADSATLGWTSTGTLFDIEYGATGFTPTGTPTVAGVANPYILTATPGAYQFYVRQDCGDGDTSLWTGPYTFIIGSYTGGDIPTQYNTAASVTSTDYCTPEATLTIEVPTGYEIASLQVMYSMTAHGGAWMSEQHSFIYSPTLSAGEATLAQGTGNAGTFNYNRALTFANGATGTVDFVLRAWRTWGGADCGTTYNYVNNGTWVLIPTFVEIPCDAVTPTGDAIQTLTLGETLADLTVTSDDDLVWYSDEDLTVEIPETTVAVDETIYYVVSETDTCQSDALAITVVVYDPCANVIAPIGATEQSLLLGQTLEGLTVAGDNLTWYSDEDLTVEIPETTAAVNGTTYYVVSETDDCQSDALAITVTVIDPCAQITTPTGDAEQTLDEGDTLEELVVNGDNLAWYADADLTVSIPATTVAQDGVTYYVASVTDICQSEGLAITVTIAGIDPCEGVEVPAPTGEEIQTLTEGQTLADLEVEGENLQWYADADLTEPLEETHVAEETTYYVTQTIGVCTGEALAVTVQFTVGTTDFEVFAFSFYPNPVSEVLQLTSNVEIKQIDLFNMLGQKVNVFTNANNTQVDMSGLPTGNYIISVTIEGITKTFKVVKN